LESGNDSRDSCRVRRSLIGFLAVVVLAACTSGSPVTGATTSAPATSSTSIPSLPAGSFQVASLGLRFTLPTTLLAVQDPSFVFLARSTAPPAVFSIDGDSPAVTTHSPRQGETLTSIDLGGLGNVVVSNAAVAGLPAGIASNELLVSNGGHSFSVILSAADADLPAMWQTFIGSVHVDPA
jgi:hypothetical protein